ncbi:MAG TPA: N-acyl homoserine lactonase family protein [Steroidobacteraceae bacterium]|jgi:glyoxylase-like metal-dependent hydrolase (beta-lactamase superfamily II)
MRRFLLAAAAVMLLGADATPEYSIEAIRYANSPGDSVADLVIGAPKDEKVDTVFALWLIRGAGRNILFDSGFHRARWFKEWTIKDYLRPDEAVRLAGVNPEDVTDIVISHAHWDHMGGIDLFPKAAVWIQKEEFRYYTAEAWQPGGDHDGIDPDDVQQLLWLNTQGRLHLVDGDAVQIFPGIRAYTGGRHTYASQYLRVEGHPPFVLASDNVYLYRNLAEHKPSATFAAADHAANLRNQQRMIELAGSVERVVPGHDALQFQKFPTRGRVATLK